MTTETKTPYAGLDYSLGRSNVNKETGIHYGVISQNSVMPEALDDIMTYGEDLAWEEALAEAIAEAKATAAEGEEIDEDSISESLSEGWESSLGNYLYESEGYKLTGCLDSDLFVMASRFFTYAQFCSPCVPGAGNLDSAWETLGKQVSAAEIVTLATAAGFPRAYCLGHDWFDGGRAPYPVFSVESGALVEPPAAD